MCTILLVSALTSSDILPPALLKNFPCWPKKGWLWSFFQRFGATSFPVEWRGNHRKGKRWATSMDSYLIQCSILKWFFILFFSNHSYTVNSKPVHWGEASLQVPSCAWLQKVLEISPEDLSRLLQFLWKVEGRHHEIHDWSIIVCFSISKDHVNETQFNFVPGLR